AGYFDIAWQNHPREKLKGKVLLPILDEPYGKVIQAGRLKPYFEQGRFGIKIDEMRLPLDPRSYGTFLEPALESLRSTQADDAPEVLELQSVLTAIRHLAPRDNPDATIVAESLAEITVIKRRLRELVEKYSNVAEQIDKVVCALGACDDHSSSFARL